MILIDTVIGSVVEIRNKVIEKLRDLNIKATAKHYSTPHELIQSKVSHDLIIGFLINWNRQYLAFDNLNPNYTIEVLVEADLVVVNFYDNFPANIFPNS